MSELYPIEPLNERSRKHKYETLLKIVDAQTTRIQRPSVRESYVLENVTNRGMDKELATSMLRAAVDNSDLIRVYGDRLVLVEKAKLKRLIGRENQQENPDLELIERVVALLDTLEA